MAWTWRVERNFGGKPIPLSTTTYLFSLNHHWTVNEKDIVVSVCLSVCTYHIGTSGRPIVALLCCDGQGCEIPRGWMTALKRFYFNTSLCLSPIYIYIHISLSQVNGAWTLPNVVCDFYIAMDVICSTSSIFNLVAISIDRYVQRVWMTGCFFV